MLDYAPDYYAVMDGGERIEFFAFSPENGETYSGDATHIGYASVDDVNGGWSGTFDTHDISFENIESLDNHGLWAPWRGPHVRLKIERFQSDADAVEAYG